MGGPGASPLLLRGFELSGPYRRFRIETRRAPPLYREPNRYEPIVRKSRLALLLLREFHTYILSEVFKPSNWRALFTGRFYRELVDGTLWSKFRARWRVLLDRPCIYGVFSGPLGGFRPRKDLCTGCMRCKQEYPDVIEDVVWGREFRSMAFLGYRPEDVYTIWYEAREGKELVKGMGYRGPFAGPGWDSIWLDMSEIVRPTRDGKMGREYISTAVDIGRRPEYLKFDGESTPVKTVRIELPVLFDCAETGWLNRETIAAVVEAARRCGTLALFRVDTYLTLPASGRLYSIPIITPEQVNRLGPGGPAIPLVEVEIQGEPFPPRSGVWADIVIARVSADDSIEERALRLVQMGYDGIHLTAPPDGRNIGGARRHIKDVIRAVHTRLVHARVRDQVTLLATGGILMGEHVPKAVLCGCDAVGIDTSLHIALQARITGRGGVFRVSPRRFDPEWGAQRLTNLMAAWHEQFIEALSAMGKRDGRRLRGDVGRGIFYEDMVREAFGDIEYAGAR